MRRAALLTSAVGTAVVLGCSSGGGGGNPSGSPTPTPTSGPCSAWRLNDQATDGFSLLGFQSPYPPTGAASVSNGTLVLSYHGALQPGQPAVLYAKDVVDGDFDATVHLDSYSASTTGLTAFFAVIRDDSGRRGGKIRLTRLPTPNFSIVAEAWSSPSENDAGRGFNPAPSGPWHIRHAAGTFMVYGTGAPGFSTAESVAGPTHPMTVGFGIQTDAADPIPSADVTARFSGLVVVSTAGASCFPNGFQ